MDGTRINKYIADAGVCSRRKAEELVLAGKVKLNGIVVTNLATLVSKEDDVEVEEKRLERNSKNVYIMVNKPKGYVSTAKEQYNRPSVVDLVDCSKRVYPVGRLDMDSTGLILLTNDGKFTNSITHPTNHIEKTYEVTLKEKLLDSQVTRLQTGVDIGGYVTKPCKVKRLADKKVQIVIAEGKNRQIRRMIESVDGKVLSLKRTAIGKLSLGNIKEGEYIYLSEKDIKKIYS